MKKITNLGLLLLIVFISSCKVADVRTTYMKKDTGTEKISEEKGKALLKEAWLAQGFDKLNNFTTYQVEAVDHWKGTLGKMGNLWGDSNNKPITMKFVVGSFDAQVEFKEGKRAGQKAGMQSWNYYEQATPDSKVEFKKTNKRHGFGMAAYQYFFEFGDRLSKAPIIRYAGTKEYDGNTYDIVFATWGSVKANPDYDQYQLWINRKTKLIEISIFTIRESYLPGAKGLPGVIRFSDFRDVQGVKIPFISEIFSFKPKESRKYLHRLTVSEFKFDAFPSSDLYPDKSIKPIGDDKPTSKVLGK